MVYTYMITIRKSQVLDYVSFEELWARVVGLKLRLPDLHIQCSGYEAHGTYKQLHVHLLAYSPKRINYRNINKYFNEVTGANGSFIYHFRLCNISCKEDMQAICDYICKYDKNMYEREMITVINYYRYNYGF